MTRDFPGLHFTLLQHIWVLSNAGNPEIYKGMPLRPYQRMYMAIHHVRYDRNRAN